MKTIMENWSDFESRCIPENASSVQRRDMRLAFFAGAAVMLNATLEIAHGDDVLIGVLTLKSFHQECLTFLTRA